MATRKIRAQVHPEGTSKPTEIVAKHHATSLENVRLAFDGIDQELVRLLACGDTTDMYAHVRKIAACASLARGIIAIEGWGRDEVTL